MAGRRLDHKQLALIEYKEQFRPKVFIETGTFRGDTIKAMLPHFEMLFTVDLEQGRAERAQRRFASFPKVTCLYGDSTDVLPAILENIDEPVLFWLDAHYSGTKTAHGKVETPIIAELKTVLEHKWAAEHVILIDDARYFIDWPKRTHDYPTLQQIEDIVRAKFPDWVFLVKDDIIRTHHGNDAKTG